MPTRPSVPWEGKRGKEVCSFLGAGRTRAGKKIKREVQEKEEEEEEEAERRIRIGGVADYKDGRAVRRGLR